VVQFRRVLEQVCFRWPDVPSLWECLGSSTAPILSVPLRPSGHGSATSSGKGGKYREDVLPAAEPALRALHGHIQTALLALAPFTGAASFHALTEYVEDLQRQPVLRALPLHYWDKALDQAVECGLLALHPANSNYLALPAETATVLRRRLTYVPPSQRLGMEAAMHATYIQIAGKIGKSFAVNDAGKQSSARAMAKLEYHNLRTALDYGLKRQWNVGPIYAALNAYLLESGQFHRGLEMGQKLLASMSRLPDDAPVRLRVQADVAEYQRRLDQQGTGATGPPSADD
jgi:hypothetical protein